MQTHPAKMDCVDDLPCAADFLRIAEQRCAERRLNLTPLRSDVLRHMAASPRPLKAYDLLALLHAEHVGTAPAAIYRTLEFLLDLGVIHKLETTSAFSVCQHLQSDHTPFFLVCDTCSRTIEMDDASVPLLLDRQAQQIGFTSRGHTLEVHGHCADCRRISGARKVLDAPS